MICDWWFRVDCGKSVELYDESAEQLEADQKVYKAKADERERRRKLSKAYAAGTSDQSEETQRAKSQLLNRENFSRREHNSRGNGRKSERHFNRPSDALINFNRNKQNVQTTNGNNLGVKTNNENEQGSLIGNSPDVAQKINQQNHNNIGLENFHEAESGSLVENLSNHSRNLAKAASGERVKNEGNKRFSKKIKIIARGRNGNLSTVEEKVEEVQKTSHTDKSQESNERNQNSNVGITGTYSSAEKITTVETSNDKNVGKDYKNQYDNGPSENARTTYPNVNVQTATNNKIEITSPGYDFTNKIKNRKFVQYNFTNYKNAGVSSETGGGHFYTASTVRSVTNNFKFDQNAKHGTDVNKSTFFGSNENVKNFASNEEQGSTNYYHQQNGNTGNKFTYVAPTTTEKYSNDNFQTLNVAYDQQKEHSTAAPTIYGTTLRPNEPLNNFNQQNDGNIKFNSNEKTTNFDFKSSFSSNSFNNNYQNQQHFWQKNQQQQQTVNGNQNVDVTTNAFKNTPVSSQQTVNTNVVNRNFNQQQQQQQTVNGHQNVGVTTNSFKNSPVSSQQTVNTNAVNQNFNQQQQQQTQFFGVTNRRVSTESPYGTTGFSSNQPVKNYKQEILLKGENTKDVVVNSGYTVTPEVYQPPTTNNYFNQNSKYDNYHYSNDQTLENNRQKNANVDFSATYDSQKSIINYKDKNFKNIGSTIFGTTSSPNQPSVTTQFQTQTYQPQFQQTQQNKLTTFGSSSAFVETSFPVTNTHNQNGNERNNNFFSATTASFQPSVSTRYQTENLKSQNLQQNNKQTTDFSSSGLLKTTNVYNQHQTGNSNFNNFNNQQNNGFSATTPSSYDQSFITQYQTQNNNNNYQNEKIQQNSNGENKNFGNYLNENEKNYKFSATTTPSYQHSSVTNYLSTESYNLQNGQTHFTTTNNPNPTNFIHSTPSTPHQQQQQQTFVVNNQYNNNQFSEINTNGKKQTPPFVGTPTTDFYQPTTYTTVKYDLNTYQQQNKQNIFNNAEKQTNFPTTQNSNLPTENNPKIFSHGINNFNNNFAVGTTEFYKNDNVNLPNKINNENVKFETEIFKSVEVNLQGDNGDVINKTLGHQVTEKNTLGYNNNNNNNFPPTSPTVSTVSFSQNGLNSEEYKGSTVDYNSKNFQYTIINHEKEGLKTAESGSAASKYSNNGNNYQSLSYFGSTQKPQEFFDEKGYQGSGVNYNLRGGSGRGSKSYFEENKFHSRQKNSDIPSNYKTTNVVTPSFSSFSSSQNYFTTTPSFDVSTGYSTTPVTPVKHDGNRVTASSPTEHTHSNGQSWQTTTFKPQYEGTTTGQTYFSEDEGYFTFVPKNKLIYENENSNSAKVSTETTNVGVDLSLQELNINKNNFQKTGKTGINYDEFYREGLEVPPSSGPNAIRSFALYFADNTNNQAPTTSSPSIYVTPSVYTTVSLNSFDNKKKEVLKQVNELVQQSSVNVTEVTVDSDKLPNSLTVQTQDSYLTLFSNNSDKSTIESSTVSSKSGEESTNGNFDFKSTNYGDFTEEPTVINSELVKNDLDGSQTRGLVEPEPVENDGKVAPDLRKLAQVFTKALSAYLDDPQGFRKVLTEVRPTEPTFDSNESESNEYSTATREEEEVLDFSDVSNNSYKKKLSTPSSQRESSTEFLAEISSPTVSDFENLIAPVNKTNWATNIELTAPLLESLDASQSNYYSLPTFTGTTNSVAEEINQFIDHDQTSFTGSIEDDSYFPSTTTTTDISSPPKYGGFQNNTEKTKKYSPYGSDLKTFSPYSPIADNQVSPTTPKVVNLKEGTIHDSSKENFTSFFSHFTKNETKDGEIQLAKELNNLVLLQKFTTPRGSGTQSTSTAPRLSTSHLSTHNGIGNRYEDVVLGNGETIERNVGIRIGKELQNSETGNSVNILKSSVSAVNVDIVSSPSTTPKSNEYANTRNHITSVKPSGISGITTGVVLPSTPKGFQYPETISDVHILKSSLRNLNGDVLPQSSTPKGFLITYSLNEPQPTTQNPTIVNLVPQSTSLPPSISSSYNVNSLSVSESHKTLNDDLSSSAWEDSLYDSYQTASEPDNSATESAERAVKSLQRITKLQETLMFNTDNTTLHQKDMARETVETMMDNLNLTASTTHALMHVMEEAAKNETYRRLVLLLVNDKSGRNKTAEEARVSLLKALLTPVIVSHNQPNPSLPIQDTSKLAASANDDKTIDTNVRRSKSIPNRQTSGPLIQTTTSRSSSINKNAEIQEKQPPKTTTTTTTTTTSTILPPSKIYKKSKPDIGNIGALRRAIDNSKTKQVKINSIDDAIINSDSRAVELLRSLYSLAARWG